MEPAMFCFVSFLTFCALVLLGYHGSTEVAVGPGCSLLVQVSSVFVKDIKVGLEAGPRVSGGLVLYGLTRAPPMDVAAAEWSDARCVLVPANSHREWVYFLNKGARLEAAYSVESETDVPYPLCIVIIAPGKDGFTQWLEKPTENSTALSWHFLQGKGTIEQIIDQSSEYYIVLRSLNGHQDTTVQLNFSIRTSIYNTMGAEYRCSLGQDACTYSLPFLGENVAVLSSGLEERLDSGEQRVKLSYEPRWMVYVMGSAVIAIVLMLLYEIVSLLCDPCAGAGGLSAVEVEQRTPLLTSKEDDSGSLGSSYDSVSDDGDVEEGGEGASAGCVVCCDARKDCFFLPCGHSATCYACGARILEEHGSCPLCRRKLKKVRRIFTA